MAQYPCDDARNRYMAANQSSIFEPAAPQSRAAFVPAGKRRDLTTAEMFGNYDEKDLRGMPKTFVPKDSGVTAQQMKMHFLSSEAQVLPCTTYPAGAPRPLEPRQVRTAGAVAWDDESEDAVDHHARRHDELSSQLFGRKTPETCDELAFARTTRLTPTDFKWHSHPEAARSLGPEHTMNHAQRAYQEKCSTILNHQSPEVPDNLVDRRLAREEEDSKEQMRRFNANYSDLFGRSAHPDMTTEQLQSDKPSETGGRWRPKAQVDAADQIAVHQDWMDSKTELMGGPRSNRPEHPALRKSDELHRNRIFCEQESSWLPPDKLDAMTHDNSMKLRNTFGQTTQQIHQAHMRTSITPNEFYEGAERAKRWDVVELHLSGLPQNADEAHVRKLCQGFDLQLVKVAVDVDPVSNLCKGRGKVVVRHNAQQEEMANLVNKLEAARLRVEV